MNLSERQDQMIREINALGDCFDQYSYLIVKAGQLSKFPEAYHKDEYLIPGCQSKVWFHGWVENGWFYMAADSDTLILRGVLALFMELLSGQRAAEVAGLEVSLLSETELTATFTSARNTGVRSLLRQIRAAASER